MKMKDKQTQLNGHLLSKWFEIDEINVKMFDYTDCLQWMWRALTKQFCPFGTYCKQQSCSEKKCLYRRKEKQFENKPNLITMREVKVAALIVGCLCYLLTL